MSHALDRLGWYNARYRLIRTCKYFDGFSIEETAQALSISVSTHTRDWRPARAWLKR